MKKSGVFAASVAAASATAIAASSSSSSSSSSTNFYCNSNFSRQGDGERRDREDCARPKPASTDKFAPRFDGLRFIETLVTAHR